jgi:hypothetical protein
MSGGGGALNVLAQHRQASAEKRNPRHMGNDRRDFDVVIGLADELRRI